MRKRVFFLTTLKEGKSPEEYERFIREVDYPLTARLLPVSHYEVARVEGRVVGDGAALYQYIDVIDVEDIDRYREALASPTAELRNLLDQVESWIASAEDLFGSSLSAADVQL